MDTNVTVPINTRFNFVSYAFVYAGLIIILITSWSKTSGGVTGSIAGNSAVLAGVIGITAIKIQTSNWFNRSNIEVIIPTMLLIASILFNLITTSTFFKQIEHGSIPYYNTFVFVYILLACSQIYLLFYGGHTNTRINTRLATLFGLVNAITTTTMYIILKYYPTDC